MARVRAVLLGMLLCACLALPGLAQQPADAGAPDEGLSQVRIVRLSYLDGPVDIDRRTGSGWERAILNMPVTQGVVLKTGETGRAEVQLEDGSTVRLVPDSQVTFEQLGLRASGAKVSTVDVDQGTVYVDLRHAGKDEFTVAFANRQLELTRPAHFRVEVGSAAIKLAVFSGELRLRAPERGVTIKKNETLTLDREDTGRYVLAQGAEASDFDPWDKSRDAYEQQYSSASNYGSSLYSYGRDDLNYYGAYTYQPGYGYLWRPYNTGFGWDPFLDGAWMWYPGFGYTWVSQYPWGWLPYRYGSWTYVAGWGWGWMPGNYWNRWTVVPRVLTPPSGYVRPTPPSAFAPAAPTFAPTPPRTTTTRNPTIFVGNPRRPSPKMIWEGEARPGWRSSPASNGVVTPPTTVMPPLPAPSASSAPVATTVAAPGPMAPVSPPHPPRTVTTPPGRPMRPAERPQAGPRQRPVPHAMAPAAGAYGNAGGRISGAPSLPEPGPSWSSGRGGARSSSGNGRSRTR